MSEIAEALNKTRGRTAKDALAPETVLKRTRNARLHLRELAKIAPQLDPDDYNQIREELTPIIETFQSQYSKPKTSTKHSS